MKRLLLILMLLLAACGGGESQVAEPADEAGVTDAEVAEAEPTEVAAAPTAEPTDVPTEVPTEAPTEEPVAEVEVEAVDDETNMSTESDDRVIDVSSAATTPQEAYVTRPGDHYKGAEDPDVLIIEYGDFQ